MLLTPPPLMRAAHLSPPLTCTHTATVWDDNLDLTHTFTGVNFGSAEFGEYRMIVVAISSEYGTVETIGGYTATMAVSTIGGGGTYHYPKLYTAMVPTGTSGSVSVADITFACMITVFSVINPSSETPTDITNPITIPNGGCAIGVVSGGGSTPTWSWTNLTEVSEQAYDTVIYGYSGSAAYSTTPGTLSRYPTPNPANDWGYAVAAWSRG